MSDNEWVKTRTLEDGTIETWEPQYEEVLDSGFIGLVDFVGSDSAVINAARVSYGKGTKATRSDEGLIRYLMRHWHSTPFEMCEFVFHVKAPIFVFRQWHRHRTASINEMSARYSILDNEMYIPALENTSPQAKDNKQGREGNLLSEDDYNAVVTALSHVNENAYQTYLYLNGKNEDGVQPAAPDELQNRHKIIEEAALNSIKQAREDQMHKPVEEQREWTEEDMEDVIRQWFDQSETHVITKDYPGIARELARMVLPVATYSQMYWKANLHNIMHFLRLRADSHAQYEVRVYADAMIKMIEPIVPMSMKAFEDYRLNGTSLSAMESKLIAAARDGDIDFTDETAITEFLENEGCSSREVTEFLKRY